MYVFHNDYSIHLVSIYPPFSLSPLCRAVKQKSKPVVALLLSYLDPKRTDDAREVAYALAASESKSISVLLNQWIDRRTREAANNANEQQRQQLQQQQQHRLQLQQQQQQPLQQQHLQQQQQQQHPLSVPLPLPVPVPTPLNSSSSTASSTSASSSSRLPCLSQGEGRGILMIVFCLYVCSIIC